MYAYMYMYVHVYIHVCLNTYVVVPVTYILVVITVNRSFMCVACLQGGVAASWLTRLTL